MRKKNNHSKSSIPPKVYSDFQIYKDLKNLQKTTNPYSITRLSTVKKSRPPSHTSLPIQLIDQQKSINTLKSLKKIPNPSYILEEKSQQIANLIENQIQDDVKHYSKIGENALSSFREKVSLYNSYFTRYICESQKDISAVDLVVQPFSLFAFKEEPEEGSVSPQEKIRRQRNRGSIFGKPEKESFKLSPHSPTNSKSKNMNFKETFYRGGKDKTFIFSHTPKSMLNVKKVETKNDVLINDFPLNEKKEKDYKNTWEYSYYLGKTSLNESQKKLDLLKNVLNNKANESDEQNREFFQSVKKGDLHKVKSLLEFHKHKDVTFKKNKKFINTIDTYVKLYYT